MRDEKTKKILELARSLASSAEGLTLGRDVRCHRL